MNDLRKFFFIVILCHVPFGTIISQEFPFPDQDKIKGQKSGDCLFNTTFYKWSDSEHKTDFVLMNVPENRANKNSRLLQIPIIRIYCDSEKPAKPVFTLAGGPGATNIAPIPPVWLLKNHDLVMVGYRGVDGSVSLQCPEPVEFMKQNSGSPLSKDYLQAIGDAYDRAFQRLSAAVKRSADIILTIRNVLKNLPSSWNGIPINIDHVRMAMFMNLFHVGTAA